MKRNRSARSAPRDEARRAEREQGAREEQHRHGPAGSDAQEARRGHGREDQDHQAGGKDRVGAGHGRDLVPRAQPHRDDEDRQVARHQRRARQELRPRALDGGGGRNPRGAQHRQAAGSVDQDRAEKRDRRAPQGGKAHPALPDPERHQRKRRREEGRLLGEEREQEERRRGEHRAAPEPQRRPERGEEEEPAEEIGPSGDEVHALRMGRMQREDDRPHRRQSRLAGKLPGEEPEKEGAQRVDQEVREVESRRHRAVLGAIQGQAQDREGAEVRVVEQGIPEQRVEGGTPEPDYVPRALQVELGADHDLVVPDEAVPQGRQVGQDRGQQDRDREKRPRRLRPFGLRGRTMRHDGTLGTAPETVNAKPPPSR
jgi:hypothetical protein